mgnify:FL=1|jgi:hypothetical protein
MKKVLCDKDGKFISIHDGDYYLMELNDGDCLTHEDGTILIYRECEREDTKVAYHAFLRYGEKLHTYKNGYPFTHYDLIPAYRFSTSEEKKLINDVLSENGVYYDEKEKCLKKLRWRAVIGNSYYYINFDSFEVFIETESDFSEDNKRYKNLNYFQTKEEAEKKLFEVKAVLND